MSLNITKASVLFSHCCISHTGTNPRAGTHVQEQGWTQCVSSLSSPLTLRMNRRQRGLVCSCPRTRMEERQKGEKKGERAYIHREKTRRGKGGGKERDVQSDTQSWEMGMAMRLAKKKQRWNYGTKEDEDGCACGMRGTLGIMSMRNTTTRSMGWVAHYHNHLGVDHLDVSSLLFFCFFFLRKLRMENYVQFRRASSGHRRSQGGA